MVDATMSCARHPGNTPLVCCRSYVRPVLNELVPQHIPRVLAFHLSPRGSGIIYVYGRAGLRAATYIMRCAARRVFGHHSGHNAQAARGNHFSNAPVDFAAACPFILRRGVRLRRLRAKLERSLGSLTAGAFPQLPNPASAAQRCPPSSQMKLEPVLSLHAFAIPTKGIILDDFSQCGEPRWEGNRSNVCVSICFMCCRTSRTPRAQI